MKVHISILAILALSITTINCQRVCLPKSDDEKKKCEEKGDYFCECSNSCIPEIQVCNGENYCCTGYNDDGKTCADPKSLKDFEAPDEENCQCPNPNDQFKCIQKGKQRPVECIPKDKTCNGNDDCQDGSDESPLEAGCCLSCASCGDNVELTFTCKHEDGKLLPLVCGKKCDGKKDCVNGLDEMDCPPPPAMSGWLIFFIILIVLLVIALLAWLFWRLYLQEKYQQVQQFDLSVRCH